MGLKDLQLPTSIVEIPGGSFTVRGLSTVELELLLREHRATFTAMFDQLKEVGGGVDDNTFSLAAELLSSAPELMARIICFAADEPDAIEFALKLTPAIQLKALMRIAALTFTVEGDLGKLMGGLVEKVGGLNQVLKGTSELLESIRKT